MNALGQGLKYHIERAPPKVVISKRLEYLEKFESHVEKYDRYKSLEMYKKSCHAVAKDCFHDFHLIIRRRITMKTIVSLLTQILKISVSSLSRKANQKMNLNPAIKAKLIFQALIRNTTIGINSIVSSLGQKIKGTLILSHVYAAMRNTMDLHRNEFKVNLHYLDSRFWNDFKFFK